jgi:tetratricopeptide (TPR) repeat protein
MDHVQLIIQGSEAHQQGDYHSALTLFEQAYQQEPQCAVTIYYYANALFMTDNDSQAQQILAELLAMEDTQVVAGCTTAHPDILSYKIDGFYLMFHIVLHLNQDWKEAVKYARQHLQLRQPGIESTWTKKFIKKEMAELERDFQEE